MKMIVRRYEKVDIPVMTKIVMTEVPKLPNYAKVKISEDRVKFLLTHNAGDESAFMVRLLCADDGSIQGGIAAYCVTQLLSWDKTTGDIFLFVNEQFRTYANAKMLIESYVEWAKERKAVDVYLGHTSGHLPDSMNSLFTKLSFTKLGAVYRLM